MVSRWLASDSLTLLAEAHPGVQDMACDTFIKISKQCKKHFVQVQTGEAHPFIMDILRNLHTHVHDLVPQQVCTFFEAVGYMISAQGDPGVMIFATSRSLIIVHRLESGLSKI